MAAGAKFPEILERRLADCKVLLALIGPEWLNAKNEAGQRRIDDPEDWVRLEILRALDRQLTVIPVRLGGAELPKRASLPQDICRLLDRQAVSVSTTSFRNDMSGLVRDIRTISTVSSEQSKSGVSGWFLILVLLLIGFIAVYLWRNSSTTNKEYTQICATKTISCTDWMKGYNFKVGDACFCLDNGRDVKGVVVHAPP
jgi:hypothetical protein